MIYTTMPDKDIAEKVARMLVEERLAACANLFPIDSVYRWKGKEVRPQIEEAREYVIILKTRKELYQKVEKRIKELHPYKLPAIISYKIEKGLSEYLKWIGEETGGKIE